MRDISNSEQRSYRVKSLPPAGLRRRRAPASSRPLSNVPHCLRRHSSPASRRRSQRGPREFHHGLPGVPAQNISSTDSLIPVTPIYSTSA